MTVSTTNNRIAYTGNGSTTVFAFPYKFIATSDILVYVAGLQVTTGFTVGTPSDSGANITFTTAPALNAAVVLISSPSKTQSTSLPSTGPFPAKSVETMADKLTLLVQRLSDLVSRSLTLSDGDASTTSLTLPTPAPNALLGWDATGTVLINTDGASLASGLASEYTYSQVFSGNGSQTVFVLSSVPGALSNTDVYISGVHQMPTVDYTISGTTLTFTTAPPTNTNKIQVKWNTVAGLTGVAAQATLASGYATAASSSASAASSSASAASSSATASAASATTASNYVGNIINNPILGDDVFSGNASTTVFTLSRSVTASTETALLVTIGGVVQAPTAAYTASGTTLTFASAPASGTNNIRVRYIGAMAVNAALAQTYATNAAASAASAGGAELVYVIDGLGSVPSAGSKGFLEIPFNCTINSWTLLADQSGSITVDVKKSTYSGFPTTASITASATPALSSAQKAQSSTLTGWTTTLSAGDILEYVVTGSPATLTRATLNLKVTRT